MDNASAPGSGRNFKNLLEVLEYLQAAGWKIGKSALYNHRDEGKIKAEADGSFTRKRADAYARSWLQPLNRTGNQEIDDLELRRKQAAAVKEKAMAEHWELKTRQRRGELIKRNTVDDLLAQRAGFLRQDLEQFFQLQAVELITLVAGDPDREQALIDFATEQLEEWLDRYTKPMEGE